MQPSKKDLNLTITKSHLSRKSNLRSNTQAHPRHNERFLINHWIHKLEANQRECSQMLTLLKHLSDRRKESQRQNFIRQLQHFRHQVIPEIKKYIQALSPAELNHRIQHLGQKHPYTIVLKQMAEFEMNLHDLRKNIWSFISDTWPVHIV